MMSFTEADRLANEGPMLTLTDGRKLRLHYGYGGLRRIEKHFGSVGALLRELDKNIDGEMWDTVFMGLLFGLWKYRITEDELEDNLDPSDITEHGEILSEAILLAFPKQAQEAAAANLNEGETTTESTGPTLITSPPSFVPEPLASSGI